MWVLRWNCCFFFQAEDGIRDGRVTGVQTCALPISDRAMFGYFGSKLAAERVVTDSGLPWTTLRATQFYDLILTLAQVMAKLPLIPVPAGFRFQPIDAAEVADRLVE